MTDTKTIRSYRPQVQVFGDDGWHGNDLRFATEAEALDYLRDLVCRWISVRGDFRVAPSENEPNYRWTGKLTAIACVGCGG